MKLEERYRKEIAPKLLKEFNFKSIMAVPKVTKVVLSLGLGEAIADHGVIAKASEALAEIAGQKPVVTKARTSISSFKLRAGEEIGLKVTLRKKRMYDFLEKLFRVVLPRLRDFQGVSLDSFDGRGNYNLGLAEQTVFPEVDFTKLDKVRGLQVTIVTSAVNREPSKKLLELLGMPFAKEK